MLLITPTAAAQTGRMGIKLPNAGHLRVTVSVDEVRVEYVRAFLPKDEGGEQKNGAVAMALWNRPPMRIGRSRAS